MAKIVLPLEIDLSDGLNTSQTGPSTPVAGPFIYNLNAYSSNVEATGADKRVMGRYVQFDSGGSREKGGVYAEFIRHRHLSDSDAGDHTALVAITDSYAENAGDGELFGINTAAYAHDGCVSAGLNGIEVDPGIKTGATVGHRFGVNVINDGELTATNQDAAFSAMSCVDGGGFKALLLLSKMWNFAPLQETGDVLAVDGAQMVANVLNLTDLTVTGDIIKSTNATLKGSGQLNLAGPVVINSTAPEFLLYDSDGPTDGKYFSFYAQGGVFKIDNISDAGARANRLTLPVTKPVVSGSRSSSAAMVSLLAALAQLGLITDSTTP